MTQGKIKVVFIARHFPPGIGGAEKLNYDLAQKLKEKTDLVLIANKGNKLSPLFILSSFLRALRVKKPDLFFLTDAAVSPLILFIKIFKRRPVVIKVHGLDITFNNKVYQLIIPRLVNRADKVICISKATKKECIKRGIKESKCRVINIGIDPPLLDKFDKSKLKKEIEQKFKINLCDKKIIISVGALVKRKGVYWFIQEVITRLARRRKDFIYLIIGDIIYKGKRDELDYKKEIIKLIQSKNLTQKVFLLGRIDNQVLENLYKIADIFVMPNIPVYGDIEGFGIVNLEAASYGLPVVASNLEGIAEAIQDGKNGFLVEPQNTERFIKIINNLLDDARLRIDFGRKAKKFTLSHYGWGKIVEQYLNLFNSCLKGENNKT